MRREQSVALEPLTETQQEFAAANHALIFSFLRQKRLKPCEFYDIAAMGYLDAVKQYTTRSSLTRYQFSTIAWRAMGRNVAQFFRAEERRLACEMRYADLCLADQRDAYTDLETRLVLYDLFQAANPEQVELARLRLQGYSIAQAAKAQGKSPKRVRRLLKDLLNAYLRLRGGEINSLGV